MDDPAFSALRIDSERLQASFDELAQIGATPEGGVHRPALSEVHLEARRWFLAQAKRAGLDVYVDGAGNHCALLRCGPAGGPTLLLGSHLDSVPQGGRFDGALGVLAALEVLQVVKARGLALNAHLEAIDFTDEEGHLVGLLGSLALAGQLREEHLQHPHGGRESFLEALDRAWLREGDLLAAARDPAGIAGYLELHIEQGPRLYDQGIAIGVVTSVVGIRSYRIRFVGRADHAGTTPMESRRDAAQGASAFTLAARELVVRDFPGGVVNVGNMEFYPAAFNVVPGMATLALQFRAEQMGTLEAMEAALLEQASLAAARFGLDLETERLESIAPAQMDARMQGAIARASDLLGLKHTFLTSGAGHDAQAMSSICSSGMIFVPSVGGFSHSAREFTAWQDCVNGANVLLQTALALT